MKSKIVDLEIVMKIMTIGLTYADLLCDYYSSRETNKFNEKEAMLS